MSKNYLLKNCKLIPELTEGTSLDEADVLIEHGRIAEIREVGRKSDEKAEELDIEGAYLLPGLIDAHVHLRWMDEKTWVYDIRPSWRSFDELRFAKFMLENGYTTLRDCGDDRCCASEALRDAEKEGIVEAPRIICAGPTINTSDVNSFTCLQYHYVVAGRDEMRRQVRQNICYGADFIKLYGSGSLMTAGNDPNIQIMEADEMEEAVRTATARGKYCAIHAHGSKTIDTAVRAGIRTIEHASFISEETLKIMDGREDVGLVPTVGILSTFATHAKGSYASTEERHKQVVDTVYECIGNAYHNHNVLIGWGTDIALNTYERDPYLEMRTRKETLGFSNIDILKQMTVNSAKLLGIDDETGSVKEGKCADLIVVRDNPISDIRAMYSRPLHVMRAGKLIY